MKNKSDTHKNYKNNWITPEEVMQTIKAAFLSLNRRRRFTLDVAADENNKKCQFFISKETDAIWCENHWEAPRVFPHEGYGLYWCNPPFKMAGSFLKKAHEELELGNEGIMLVPGNQETRWFREYITVRNMPRLIWPTRIKFIDPDTGLPGKGNPIHSVLVAFIRDKSTLPPILGQPWIANL